MKETKEIKIMKYGVKAFANGKEILSKVYTDKAEAEKVASAYAKNNLHVYRFHVEGSMAKVVKAF